jgi:gluconate 2-dehydrogenase gamma chain
MTTSRRAFLGTIGGAGAVWLAASWAERLEAGTYAALAGRQDPRPPFVNLSAADAADLEAMTAQIIPTDDTPGAREARVIYFIDRGLGTFARDEKADLEKGLADLRRIVARRYPRLRPAPAFAALDAARQLAVMRVLEKSNPAFFTHVREATLAGMFSNPEYGGNYQKAGWKLIGFEDRFSWAPPFGWYDRAENLRG